MNKKLLYTAFGASAFFSFVSAQEITSQPISATLTQTTVGDVDPNGVTSSCLNLATDLRYKMKDAVTGGDVSDLQDFLISVNLMQGESTGYFGAGTLKAVKLFQQKQKLNPTGFVGPLTRTKINTLSCSGQALNLGDKSQAGRSEGQEGNGAKYDPSQAEKFDKSPTLSVEMIGLSNPTNGGVLLTSYLSETDKATLKTKEEGLRSAEEALKSYYLSVRTGTMTDEVKAKLQTLESTLKQARKDLDETRKSMLDTLKSSLTDEQKKKLESMMPRMQGNASGTMMKYDDREKRPTTQGGGTGKKPGDTKNPLPCGPVSCDSYGQREVKGKEREEAGQMKKYPPVEVKMNTQEER